MAQLPAYARPGAKFYCSSAALSAIFERLAISAGGNTMSMINGQWTPSYLGKPIETTEVMFADTTATNANGEVMLLYGNLAMATTMGERRGFDLRMSTEYKFAEDQIAMKCTERIDIFANELGTTSKAGPMVALVGTTS